MICMKGSVKKMTAVLLAKLLVTSSFTPRDFSAFSQPFFDEYSDMSAYRNFFFFPRLL